MLMRLFLQALSWSHAAPRSSTASLSATADRAVTAVAATPLRKPPLRVDILKLASLIPGSRFSYQPMPRPHPTHSDRSPPARKDIRSRHLS
jgi:hypothetical protein